MDMRAVESWSIGSGEPAAAPGEPVAAPAGGNRRLALRLGLLALLYFAVAFASLSAFGTTTPIWFANAVAVVALLREDPRNWPLALALVWGSDSLAIMLVSGGWAALLALADIVEIALAAVLIRQLGGGRAMLSSLPGLVGLIAVAMTVPLLSAALGATIIWWDHGAPLLPGILTWYGASALGLLILCPMLLVWTTPGTAVKIDRREIVQTALFAAGLALVAYVVLHANSAEYLFVLFPALLLLVWSSGLFGFSLGTAVMLLMGIWHVSHGDSTFAELVFPATAMAAQVHALQVYLTALALSSLPLAVVLTAQRQLSADLVRVAEARREFLAAMSHEIRTPMAGVLGIVDLFDEEPLSQRQRGYMDKIRASGRHLLNIINDVLDFSRIETGRIDLESIDFSVPLLLESVRSLLHPLALERGIALRFDLSPHSPPVVKGDPTRLRQVLLNLGANAIKFTHDGTVTLAVCCEPAGEGFRFRFIVQDTGIGIAADKQAGLFTAFVQADGTTRRRYGGSGLGLAISKRLVHAMGGEIGMSSVVGAGSVFWFEIPLEGGNPAALPAPPGEGQEPPTPCRILLAEDVELNRDIVTTMLEREGHQVVIAHNGRQALVQAQLSRFDLILMDVHMPVMDGIEATRRIRALPAPVGKTPIVALTANVMAAEQERCIGAGMDSVLLKPMDWDRVRAVIRQFARPEPRPERDVGRPADPPATVGDAAPGEPRLAEQELAKLRQILPLDRLRAHVRSLEREVALLASMAASTGSDSIRSSAHKIVSQAGMLGLVRLSRRAGEVEQSVLEGDRLGEALERFREAAADPRELLGDLVDQA